MNDKNENAMKDFVLIGENGHAIKFNELSEIEISDDCTKVKLRDFGNDELEFEVKMNFWQKIKFKWLMFKIWMGWMKE